MGEKADESFDTEYLTLRSLTTRSFFCTQQYLCEIETILYAKILQHTVDKGPRHAKKVGKKYRDTAPLTVKSGSIWSRKLRIRNNWSVVNTVRTVWKYIILYTIVDMWYTAWKVIFSGWWCQNVTLSITDMFVIDHKENVSFIKHKIVCD